MISWLVDNCFLIIVTLVLLVEVILTLIKFSNKPTEEKIAKFKEWLLLIVAEAEKELGGGTGKLKLRYVYDKALTQFPALTLAISFEDFSKYVDEALDEFRKMLESNEKVQEYVGTKEA